MADLTLVAFLARYGLTLRKGMHAPRNPGSKSCAVCLQEAEALRLYLEKHPEPRPGWWEEAWTDMPPTCWADLRPLNDAAWPSDEERTAMLAPLEDRLREVPKGQRAMVLRKASAHAIRVFIPITLRAAARIHPITAHQTALELAAARCEAEGSAASARKAYNVALKMVNASPATVKHEVWAALDATEWAVLHGSAQARTKARAARIAAVAARMTRDASLLRVAVQGWHDAIDAAMREDVLP